jgi:hypothetical protein
MEMYRNQWSLIVVAKLEKGSGCPKRILGLREIALGNSIRRSNRLMTKRDLCSELQVP